MSQTYETHRRWVPPYHFFLALLVLATLIGSVVNLLGASGEGLYSASLLVALSLAMVLTAFYARAFALKVQDRLIRAEENTRHRMLTGNPLDPSLTMRQIIGLRFASDGEFPALAQRAVNEAMSEDDIKKAVTDWRGDHERA